MTTLNKTIAGEELEQQDTWADTFLSKTPQEVDDWIATNVNDLASAKNVLRKLARVVVILAKREAARIS